MNHRAPTLPLRRGSGGPLCYPQTVKSVMASDPRAPLVAYLCQAGLSTARANAVLDEYTHSLAEQIRQAWADHNPKKPGNVTMLSALNAATLIDPKES